MVMAAASATAGDWGDIATISSTLGVNANRLCLGEGLRASDIGCPSYAPYVTSAGNVGIGTNAPSVPLSVSGSAASDLTKFLLRGEAGWAGHKFGWANDDGSNEYGLTLWGYNIGGNKIVQLGSYGTPSIVDFSFANDILSFAGRPLFNGGIAGPYHGDLVLNQYYNTSGSPKGIRLYSIQTSRNLAYFREDGFTGIDTIYPLATLHVSGSTRISSWTTIASNVTPSVALDVYGTISATNFVGNGGSLTGVATAAGVSGSIQFKSGSGLAGRSDIIISDSGYVGIGTTSPGQKLHVAGSGATYLELQDTSGGGAVGYVGASAALGAMDISSPNPIRFFSNGLERLRVGTDGNVGIGTTNPQYVLSVENSGNSVNDIIQLRNSSTGGLAQTRIRFDNNNAPGSATNGVIFYTGGNYSGFPANSFGFWNHANNGIVALATNNIERVRVDASGNVGIGRTTPSDTLDVSGTIKVAGTGSDTCDPNHYGAIRRNPTTGAMQVCVNR